ncbi:hypothetical protein ACLOJK_009346 [Asimina triloba]
MVGTAAASVGHVADDEFAVGVGRCRRLLRRGVACWPGGAAWIRRHWLLDGETDGDGWTGASDLLERRTAEKGRRGCSGVAGGLLLAGVLLVAGVLPSLPSFSPSFLAVVRR